MKKDREVVKRNRAAELLKKDNKKKIENDSFFF